MEFSILGSVALLALALLIQLGLRMNFQQEIQQDAFRRALALAHSEGKTESQATQYNYFRNRRIPNPSEGFGITPRVMTQGNATVTWGEWLTYLDDDRDSQPRVVVNLDDRSVPEFRAGDFPADQPLVRRVTKELVGSAEIQQGNSGVTTCGGVTALSDTCLAADTTETTTLELSNGSPVSATVTTPPIRRNW